MSASQLPDALTCTAEQLTGALLAAARSACWADGSLLVDLDDTVIRERLAPNLLSALSYTAAAPTRLGKPS
jgi:hypothetical protein